MVSDDDFELLPSSPIIRQPKLKRLKKAIRVPQSSSPTLTPDDDAPPSNSPQLETLPSDSPRSSPSGGHVEESNWGSSPKLDDGPTNLDASETDTVKEDGLGAARALDFDSLGEELVGNVEKEEDAPDLKTDELDRKRCSLDQSPEKEKKKKKKKIDGEKKLKESASNKRKAEKERQENLKQLRAESQRLLRETRDAAFKPIPLVQKPISSLLDKIRLRKLEILKKCSASFDDNDELPVDDGSERASMDEEIADKVEKVQVEETSTCTAATNSNLNTVHADGSNEAADYPSCEDIPLPMAVGSEPEHALRAPIGDTQELSYHSESTDTNEAVREEHSTPSEEVLAPSMLAMNLKLDSAPPHDDDDISSDDEDNDKENMDPHRHGPVHLSSPPSGDPVKAFVDEEAEEEDDSDNDLQHYFDIDEGEDNDDIEELNEMITPEYKEKIIDREKRDQLHQQWLEQQDTAGMDHLLQKLNCGSKLKESTLIEEEGEESEETKNESDDEAEEYIAPSDAVKINLKKAKQMIPQLFTDKDDAHVSDDEETNKMLAQQCLFEKAEEKATFLSTAEDESSREVFSRIKKLNIVPDAKRKGRTPSFFDTSLLGQTINISSKSSFIGRASNHFMPSSRKNGSSKVRSFIFERDDSNIRTSISMAEDSSDAIHSESQPQKAVSAKFQRNTQIKYVTLNSTSQKSSVSLLEILRKSSLHAEHCVQNANVEPKESVFDAFKLAKKPIKTDARV